MSSMKMSRLESALRTVLEFTEAFGRGDVEGMMALTSDECKLECAWPAPDGAACAGRDALARHWRDFFSGRSGMRREVEEAFGLGFRCVLRWKDSWVDRDGERMQERGVDIFDVRNGSIKEQLSYMKGS